METSPELLIVGVIGLIVLLGVLVVFGMKPTDDRVGTPASGADAHPENASPTVHGAAYRESGATGIAVALYALGVIALVLGGLLFVFSDNSLHQILATLIGLGGAIFFAAGAVVTELQRIKRRLDADAAAGSTRSS